MVRSSIFTCVSDLIDAMRSGNLPHSLTSNVSNRETWATSSEGVSICYFLLVVRWARGSWMLMFPPLSSSCTLGQFSTPSLDRLAIFPQTPSEKFQPVPKHRYIRTPVLLHLYPPEPQTCPLGSWKPVPAFHSNSPGVKVLPS